jgi:Uma2 family endonuclease
MTAIAHAKEIQSIPQAASDVEIPEALIYEIVNGNPIYYSGWQAVLKGEKTIQEIRANSILQAYLVYEIGLKISPLRKKYIIGSNEAGIKFGKGDHRAADIALWTKESLQGKPLDNHYSDVAPEIIIEVDTKADLLNNPNYYFDKTKHLHSKGVRRVLWVFTSSQQIMIAEKGEKWEVLNWDIPVEVVDNCVLNIQELIDDYDE